MNVFKLKPGINEILEITENNFAEATRKAPPYCEKNTQGQERYYAVCPKCDNPIQIIGLYKNDGSDRNSDRKPYGRHYPKSIANLAEYNEEDYLHCPFAMPQCKTDIKRKPESKVSLEIYMLLRNEFDKIVYILEKAIGIKISYSFAKHLLERYLEDEGWRYYDSNYDNLPYKLLLARKAYTLVGRLIEKNGVIYKKLLHDKDICFEENGEKYVKISSCTNKFLKLTFYMTKHEIVKNSNETEEFVTYVIVKDDIEIHREKVKIDNTFLSRLIKMPNWKKNRKLLEIAEELMDKE